MDWWKTNRQTLSLSLFLASFVFWLFWQSYWSAFWMISFDPECRVLDFVLNNFERVCWCFPQAKIRWVFPTHRPDECITLVCMECVGTRCIIINCYSAIASSFVAVCLVFGKCGWRHTIWQGKIVHALSLAVNVFLNLSAMNFENYSTTLRVKRPKSL